MRETLIAAGVLFFGAALYILYRVGEEIEDRPCGRGRHD